MKPFVRTPYNYDMHRASLDAGSVPGKQSLTQQSFKDDADINVLVRRFGVTGVVQGVTAPPLDMEFAEIFDYQSAMNVLRAAQESFAELSADTRARFNNDPARYVDFCTHRDDDGNLTNIAEMRKMGLAIPEPDPIPDPPPTKVEIVNPAPPPKST